MITEQLVNALINVFIITGVFLLFGYIMHLVRKIIANTLTSIFGNTVAMFVVNRLTFIGVMHHELSHALLAFISGAKVHEVSLFKPSGNKLGYVRLSYRGNMITRAFQACLSAYAPVICGTATSMMLIELLRNQSFQLWIQILLLFILVSIIMHEDLSIADIRNGLKGLPIIMFILFVFFFLSDFDIRNNIIFFAHDLSQKIHNIML